MSSYKEILNSERPCPFCHEEEQFRIDSNSTCYVIPSRAPYTEDHILICPKSHKKSLDSLSADELSDIRTLLQQWQHILYHKHGEVVLMLREWIPWGTTGKTLEHLHWHIVPQFTIQHGWSQEASDARKFLSDEEYIQRRNVLQELC